MTRPGQVGVSSRIMRLNPGYAQVSETRGRGHDQDRLNGVAAPRTVEGNRSFFVDL